MQHRTGDVLNDIYTVQEVATGAAGTTYKCISNGDGRQYTIKCFVCRFAEGPDHQRLYDEQREKVLHDYSERRDDTVDWFEVQTVTEKRIYVVKCQATTVDPSYDEKKTALALQYEDPQFETAAIARNGPPGSRCSLTRTGDTRLEIDAPPSGFTPVGTCLVCIAVFITIIFIAGAISIVAAGFNADAPPVFVIGPVLMVIIAIVTIFVIASAVVGRMFTHELWEITPTEFRLIRRIAASPVPDHLLRPHSWDDDSANGFLSVHGQTSNLSGAKVETFHKDRHRRIHNAYLFERGTVKHWIPANSLDEQEWLVNEINSFLESIQNRL